VSANNTCISGQQRRKLHRKKTKQFPTPTTVRKTPSSPCAKRWAS
jgi:hypothetical protein